jgi:hypothetical protein
MAKSKRNVIESLKPSSQDSPLMRVSQEVFQRWELRREYIGKIENELDGKVIVFFTSFYDEDIMINDKDAEMIENILSSEHKGGKIILVLNSAGGLALAAERIVNLCRAYSGNKFEVIVPHMAKSAATLICFGASQIHMSQTAELGPVDPQVPYLNNDMGKKTMISAEEYVRSYDELMAKAISGKAQHLEALLQQLTRYDARYMEQLRSAQELTKSISVKLLKSGIMSQFSAKAIEKKIKPFLLQKQTRAHGRMITITEGRECGLKIKEIPLRSELWNCLWQLFIRADWVVSSHSRKVLETTTSALSA